MQITTAPSWDDLRILLALHRHGSFLGAGRALQVSTSTAARRIDALEASLGRPLVLRSSAGTAIEPDALPLVALAEQLELGLRAAERSSAAGKVEGEVGGTVRVSCGEGFARPVTRVLSEVRKRHPALHFEVSAESRLADLARREADIGIRKARSRSPVLVERLAGHLTFGLYAAQSYVERRLRSAHVKAADLGRHDFVGYEGDLARAPQMQWLLAHGATRFPFLTSSDFALLEALEQGQGISLVAEALARDVPGLVRLDVDQPLPRTPVFIVFHRELRRVPRCRVVVTAFADAFRRALA